jgi:MFS family permease
MKADTAVRPSASTGQDAGSAGSKWWRIGGVLMFSLFVAYLDRANLSISLPGISKDLGFAGPTFADTSSWALTAFLFGYLVANVSGGFLTSRMDPKWTMVVTVAGFSTCTLLTGFAQSTGMLIALRVGLGLFEGIYWPQQFRIAKAWFTEREMTRASAMIQYYGQYLALALGFFLLTPLYDAFSWRPLFWIAGLLGLLVVLPLYFVFLRSAPPERVSGDRTGGRRTEATPQSRGVRRTPLHTPGIQLLHEWDALLGHHAVDPTRPPATGVHRIHARVVCRVAIRPVAAPHDPDDGHQRPQR